MPYLPGREGVAAPAMENAGDAAIARATLVPCEVVKSNADRPFQTTVSGLRVNAA